MMFKKNTAVTGFPIGVFINATTGAAVTTGTPTCKRILDGTGAACVNSASYNTDAGQWEIDLDAADVNADMVGLAFSLTDCLPITYRFRTTTKLTSDLNDIAATAIVSNGAITTNSGAVSTVTGVTNAVVLPTGTGVGQISLSSGAVSLQADQAVNVTKWGGTAVASAYVQANAAQISGSQATADNLEAAYAAVDAASGVVLSLRKMVLSPVDTTDRAAIDCGTGSLDTCAIYGPGGFVIDGGPVYLADTLENLDAAVSSRSSHAAADVVTALGTGSTLTAAGITAQAVQAAAESALAAHTIDTITMDSLLELVAAVVAGKATVSGNVVTFYKRNGTTAKVAITLDSATSGQRTASVIQ